RHHQEVVPGSLSLLEGGTDMRSRSRGLGIGVTVVIGAVLLLLPATSPRVGAQAREIKIGGTMAVTGAFSVEWGPRARTFMEEWAKMMNDRGGVFVKEANAKLPIKMIVYDDGSSADRAVELYERLATTDKVDFFTGPATSPITIKASTVAEKYGIPMVTAEANSPAIFARGFKWLVGADRPAPQWAEEYYSMVGASIGEGITGTTHEAIFKKGDKDAYFALRKRVGLSGFEAGWTSLRFIALEALTKAIERAGSLDRAKVMAALRDLKYETLHGQLAFSFGIEVAGKKVDGVGNKVVFPAQWQNGKIEVIWPAEV